MDAALSSPLLTTKPTPPFVAVFSEQLGLIGRALWREVAILAAAFVLFTALALFEIFEHRMQVDFPVDAGPIVALFGFLAGFAVWRGEKLFDQGHLMTLPVDRRVHIFIRTLAGGVWLFGIVAWVMLWLAGMGLLSGGDLGFDRYLLLQPPGPEGQVTLEGLSKIRWTPQTWHWLAPFATAAVFYLLGSAITVSARRQLHLALGVVGLALLFVTSPFGVGDVLSELLVNSPVGLDNLLTGGMHGANRAVTLPGGEQAIAWSHMPSMLAWAQAAAFWLALGGALLWLAAWRHRER